MYIVPQVLTRLHVQAFFPRLYGHNIIRKWKCRIGVAQRNLSSTFVKFTHRFEDPRLALAASNV